MNIQSRNYVITSRLVKQGVRYSKLCQAFLSQSCFLVSEVWSLCQATHLGWHLFAIV